MALTILGVEVSFVFKEILHLFHCCRDMDRLMESSFFDESLFDGHLADIRKRLRKEKQDKIASRVLHRLEAQQKAGSQDENDDAVEDKKEDEMMAIDGALASNGGANGDAAAASTDDNNPEYGVIWQLCSKVCNLLTVNMAQAREEISKRVTQLKSDVESKDNDGAEAIDVDTPSKEVNGEDYSASPVSKDDSSISLDAGAEGGATASAVTAPEILRPAESFLALPAAPESHKFFAKSSIPVDQRAFASAVRKELKLMASSLPNGIFVR